jgi:site-specific DNA-methyltransferase (adenine-specific)
MDTNVIYCGDNLEILPKYIPDESIDLIYIDPPFNTSRQYEVFWGEAQERRAGASEGLEITPITVEELLAYERTAST